MVIADTILPNGCRVTSMLVTWPTVKLAELRTHRVIAQLSSNTFAEIESNDPSMSLNANSSRAIPLKRQLQQVKENPYIPIWTMNQSGMSGPKADEETAKMLTKQWLDTRDMVVEQVEEMLKKNVHKQDASLLLQPYSTTVCVLTAEDEGWKNFFDLRCAENVYPAVQQIATEMRKAYRDSVPIEQDYHVAFFGRALRIAHSDKMFKKSMKDGFHKDILAMVSMSLCAKISYDTQDKEESLEKHLERALRLAHDKHYSTMEHQVLYKEGLVCPKKSNFTKCFQYRHLRNWADLEAIVKLYTETQP